MVSLRIDTYKKKEHSQARGYVPALVSLVLVLEPGKKTGEKKKVLD